MKATQADALLCCSTVPATPAAVLSISAAPVATKLQGCPVNLKGLHQHLLHPATRAGPDAQLKQAHCEKAGTRVRTVLSMQAIPPHSTTQSSWHRAMAVRPTFRSLMVVRALPLACGKGAQRLIQVRTEAGAGGPLECCKARWAGGDLHFTPGRGMREGIECVCMCICWQGGFDGGVGGQRA